MCPRFGLRRARFLALLDPRDWFRYQDRAWVERMQQGAQCRLQVQRNGAAAKEAALRWSALTRPVAYASGASIAAGHLAVPRGATEVTLHLSYRGLSFGATFVNYLCTIYHFFMNVAFRTMRH